MIRKALLGVLTAASFVSIALCIYSFFIPITSIVPKFDRVGWQFGGLAGGSLLIANVTPMLPSGNAFIRSAHYIKIPLWILAPLLALWPIIAYVRGPLRRRRRRKRGLCIQCAYDLTGNVSGVCPECGTKT